jgi:hypothetical protein
MKKVLLVIFVFIIQRGFSQELDNYYVDLTPPDLSAFQLLGNSTNDVARPSSLKELTTGIMAFNNKGKIAPGVAMEWSPGYTFGGSNPGIANYRKYYALYAFQLTGATSADTQNTACAFGLKWTPLNKADAILDTSLGNAIVNALNNDMSITLALRTNFIISLTRYIKTDLKISDPATQLSIINALDFPTNLAQAPDKDKYAVKQILDSLKATFPDDRLNYFVDRYNAIAFVLRNNQSKLDEKVDSIKNHWSDTKWNAAVITINTGIRSASPDGRWSKLQNEKFVASANAAYPLGKVAQNIWQWKYNYYLNNDSLNRCENYLGTRILLGNEFTRFSVEGLYTNYVGKGTSDERLKVAVGLEFKISEGLWFEIAGGIDQSLRTGSKPVNIASGNFKYALQKKRRF